LFAGNQEVYATAQGPVSVGGYYVQSGNQQIKKNITTSGVISGGAIVERGVGGELVKENKITLSLDQQDFGLAQQVKKSLDNLFGQGTAQTPNSAEIVLTLPEKYGDDPVAFVAEALAATVTSPDNARVVVDERTGTVVVGGEVKISKVAVSHGGLHIAIAGETKVFQPAPFSLGQSVVAEQLSLRADERAKEMVALPEGTTIEELVRALNALGTLPRDTIVILENIRAAGALHARIISR
jgi:flagellar P-ring protein precursor FlgI